MTFAVKEKYLNLVLENSPTYPTPTHVKLMLDFMNDHPDLSISDWKEFMVIRRKLKEHLLTPFNIEIKDGDYLTFLSRPDMPSSIVIDLINIWAIHNGWTGITFLETGTTIFRYGSSATGGTTEINAQITVTLTTN